MGARATLAKAAVLAGLLTLAAPASAIAQGGYRDWNPDLIGFPSNTPESAAANCAGGDGGCIDRTIGEMYRRFHEMVPECDHNNVFSLTYLRVTEDVNEAVDEGLYPDLEWIHRLDRMFARVYFLSYENFVAGRLDLVPRSWRIAFGAGARKEVQGIGNLLLSMNAHVNRDFPFVLYHVGLTHPDGASRKPEHDAYNPRLRAMYRPIVTELSQRFDETIDDYDVPGLTLDDDLLFELLVQWRESAWQYAVRLAEAPDAAARHRVAAEIEAHANGWAQLIYAGTRYLPGQGPAARDARCAAHGGQRPAYGRGSDAARVGPRALLRGRRLIARLACPGAVGPCRGVVGVSGRRGAEPGTGSIGRARFSLAEGERGRIVVGLRRGAARRLHRAGTHRLVLAARSLLGPGEGFTNRRRVRLRDG